MIRKISIWLFVSGLFMPASIFSKALLNGIPDEIDYQVELVATGFNVPWSMAFISRQELLITERNGSLKLLDLKSRETRIVDGIPPVYAKGQGGLLDIAMPPDYKKDGWLYFTYSQPVGGSGVTALARAKFNGSSLVDWHDLLVTNSLSDTTRHFGSRIAFDNNGHVFFSVGDRGVRPNGQDLLTHAGSVIRLNLDGSVPEDNPFLKHKNALPEIWSYGHRNPQGLSYDDKNKRLWLIEHGPRGGDELNLIEGGNNYGWPVISYGKEYWGPLSVGEATAKEGMEQPVKYYVPSIAPGSLLLYTGNAFPSWRGRLLSGALKLQHINVIKLNELGEAVGEVRILGELKERIRALAQSPEGLIYFSTDSGKIMRIVPLG